tara:strand:- start:1379 stop:2011 length:633 start_codon:yes stop_codon:yes gene_type:complete
MNQQTYFKFDNREDLDPSSFFVNGTNIEAFSLINQKQLNENILLIGPKKSGKTHLANIWKINNNAIVYDNNIDEIISQNKNVLVDNLFINLDEENIFHLINHCISNKLNILITSENNLFEHNFNLPDLLSRLKIFSFTKIKNPDDEILINVLTKLLIDKQFIVKNNDIFDFLLNRIKRTYEEVYNIVQKMDNMSLQKKRQLTIPSIKELI